MNPYEILGVRQRATEADIKRAYRQLAKKMHPDVGGDPEAFNDLHRAYACLMDAEARRHFDQTGEMDKKGVDHIREEAFVVITQIFNQMIDSGVLFDPNAALLGSMVTSVYENRKNVQRAISDSKSKIKKLKAARQRITRKLDDGETNVFTAIVDNHVDNYEVRITRAKRAIAALDLVLTELDAYESADMAIRSWHALSSMSGFGSQSTSSTVVGGIINMTGT